MVCWVHRGKPIGESPHLCVWPRCGESAMTSVWHFRKVLGKSTWVGAWRGGGAYEDIAGSTPMAGWLGDSQPGSHLCVFPMISGARQPGFESQLCYPATWANLGQVTWSFSHPQFPQLWNGYENTGTCHGGLLLRLKWGRMKLWEQHLARGEPWQTLVMVTKSRQSRKWWWPRAEGIALHHLKRPDFQTPASWASFLSQGLVLWLGRLGWWPMKLGLACMSRGQWDPS